MSPVAEPASVALRRLVLACDPSTVRDVCLLVDARDALADLVEAVEKREEFCDCSFGGCDWTDAENTALANLRAKLGVGNG